MVLARIALCMGTKLVQGAHMQRFLDSDLFGWSMAAVALLLAIAIARTAWRSFKELQRVEAELAEARLKLDRMKPDFADSTRPTN